MSCNDRSAQPCGCDEGAGYVCVHHLKELQEATLSGARAVASSAVFSVKDSGKRMEFQKKAGRPPIYTKEEAHKRRIAIQTASRVRWQVLAATAKLERGCAVCGYREHPDALQFDHIEPLKIKTRSRPRDVRIESFKSLERALADPNVQVLCGNCHNIKSIAERRGPRG